MAKKVSARTPEQILMDKWWLNIVLALVFLGIAYGFASLAIDSGNLLEYALAVFFVGWMVNRLVRGAKRVLHR